MRHGFPCTNNAGRLLPHIRVFFVFFYLTRNIVLALVALFSCLYYQKRACNAYRLKMYIPYGIIRNRYGWWFTFWPVDNDFENSPVKTRVKKKKWKRFAVSAVCWICRNVFLVRKPSSSESTLLKLGSAEHTCFPLVTSLKVTLENRIKDIFRSRLF